MNIYLRQCTSEDFDVLRELAIRTYYETFAPLNTPEDMAAYLKDAFNEARFAGELNDPNCEFYFLFYDNRLAGYLKLNDGPAQTDLNDPDALEIERIYVAKEFQDAGLGRYLLEQAVSMAAARKKQYAWLGVWEKNEKAIRFYKRNGFYEIGTHTFVMGEDVQTDYIMRKDLKS